MQKLLLAVASACVLAACQHEKPANAKLAAPPVFRGEWVSQDYLDALAATQSARQAQSACEICGITFDRADSSRVAGNINFHEGNSYRLIRHEGAWHLADDYTGQLTKVEVTEAGGLLLGGKKFAPIGEPGTYMSLAAHHFFAGKYSLNGQSIELKKNGECAGLGQYTHYMVLPDYIGDPGEGDRVALFEGLPQQGNPKFFGLSMSGNTLTISELKCLVEEAGDCVSEAPGKPVFILTRG